MFYGLAGIAAGVSVAILYMFVATGQLALDVTRATWPVYLRVQLGALITAAITSGVAMVARGLLEPLALSDAAIALGILIAAIPPWGLGILWTLNDPRCAPLRVRLPAWRARLVPRSSM